MAVIINISEDAIKKIEKIRFLIGGKEDRDLQYEIINAIKNRTSTDEMIAEIADYKIMENKIGYILRVIHKYCDKED